MFFTAVMAAVRRQAFADGKVDSAMSAFDHGLGRGRSSARFRRRPALGGEDPVGGDQNDQED